MALECVKGTTVPIVDVVKKAREIYTNINGLPVAGIWVIAMDESLRQYGANLNNRPYWEMVPLAGATSLISYHKKILRRDYGDVDDESFGMWLDWVIEQYSKEI